MSNGALLLGVRNQASAATVLENVAQDLSDALELHVLQPTFYKMALFALSYGMGPAIQATATRADAIRAYAVAAPDVPQNNVLVGVRGSALRAQDRGIHGEHVTAAGIGVSGLGQTGVYGESNSGFAGTGVRGEARGNGAGNEGVSGFALEGIGVRGSSVNGIGVWASGGASGLVARGTGGVAARFDGNVIVTGNLTVSGNKSAAVPHPDGSHRQLYVLESTESYFEDFGQALLQDGYAAVAIDPEFAALVRADDYNVFLTPYGDCNGLYVSDGIHLLHGA